MKPQFWKAVLDGSKRHTIRCPRKYPDAAGATMHLYGNPRGRGGPMFLLMRCACLRVEPIVLGKTFIELNGVKLTRDERDALAWRDGFRPVGSSEQQPGDAFGLMSGFWRESILPLQASIYHWEYPPLEFGERATLTDMLHRPGLPAWILDANTPIGRWLFAGVKP